MPIEKYMYKNEIAALIGISMTTLRSMLNNERNFFNELKKLGYSKYQKMLTPKQINYFLNEINFNINNENQ